jgi:hypothetical protein
MPRVATRRLIEAAAVLDPADRALLNLWVNRGLHDDRLTDLTGLSGDALHARREHVVRRLAAELGLPVADVRGALDAIAPDDEVLASPEPSGEPSSDSPHDGDGADDGDDADDGGTAAMGGEPVPSRSARPPGWVYAAGALVLLVLAAVIVGVAAGGAASRHAHRRATATATATAPGTTATPTTTATATSRSAAPAARRVTGPPGGLARASGSVRLSGPAAHPALTLTVRGLPRLGHGGRYEISLENSAVDSRPLRRLRAGDRTVTIPLPRGARRYRWIDISVGPATASRHGGESALRALNPAHTGAGLRTARTRRRFHRTPPRPAHRARRAARGSSRATTSK